MKTNYQDIVALAPTKPLWFDEQGVPRFCEFHPTRVVHRDAEEVALVEVQCQACGAAFPVALSWRSHDYDREMLDLPPMPRLTAGNKAMPHSYAYGDPPNTGCCRSGATMSSEFLRLLQMWTRPRFGVWDRWNDEDLAALPVMADPLADF